MITEGLLEIGTPVFLFLRGNLTETTIQSVVISSDKVEYITKDYDHPLVLDKTDDNGRYIFSSADKMPKRVLEIIKYELSKQLKDAKCYLDKYQKEADACQALLNKLGIEYD